MDKNKKNSVFSSLASGVQLYKEKMDRHAHKEITFHVHSKQPPTDNLHILRFKKSHCESLFSTPKCKGS